MDSSTLVRVFGFTATLIHADTLVVDRWKWLKRRLPLTANGETLLDVGCGTGSFSIGAARRGYHATGVSWDERNQRVAAERAQICNVSGADFVIGDVRRLDVMEGLQPSYDVVICLECIEHILDDRKLFRDMAHKLKPGGRLLVTTPNYYYIPISRGDRGPFLKEETGWHVRRGYTPEMLTELCRQSGLICGEISYCGGIVSQKATGLWRLAEWLPGGAAVRWLATLPLRVLPFVLADGPVTRALGLPFFSICLEAYKPRFLLTNANGSQSLNVDHDSVAMREHAGCVTS
jgi:SAM-dependent methyltransferase